jgi:hypothetical protein
MRRNTGYSASCIRLSREFFRSLTDKDHRLTREDGLYE